MGSLTLLPAQFCLVQNREDQTLVWSSLGCSHCDEVMVFFEAGYSYCLALCFSTCMYMADL